MSYAPGDKVNHLTLKTRTYVKGHNSKGRFSWICECVCGRQVTRREDMLHKSKSCGCQHSTRHKKGHASVNWKGCGRLSGQFFGMIKKGAAYRKIDFAITIEQAWELFLEQDGKCALTGLPLTLVGLRDRRRGIEQTASLDRIDSLHGYVLGNVHWVHKDINMMKKEYSPSYFLEMCRRVVLHAATLY